MTTRRDDVVHEKKWPLFLRHNYKKSTRSQHIVLGQDRRIPLCLPPEQEESESLSLRLGGSGDFSSKDLTEGRSSQVLGT
ncbi:hypothetical protein FF1_005334 [Malus domestica]